MSNKDYLDFELAFVKVFTYVEDRKETVKALEDYDVFMSFWYSNPGFVNGVMSRLRKDKLIDKATEVIIHDNLVDVVGEDGLW